MIHSTDGGEEGMRGSNALPSEVLHNLTKTVSVMFSKRVYRYENTDRQLIDRDTDPEFSHFVYAQTGFTKLRTPHD